MTTDTAVLVTKEIIEDGKEFDKMKFVVDPEIPTDELVKRYLDFKFPISSLVKGDLKVTEEIDL